MAVPRSLQVDIALLGDPASLHAERMLLASALRAGDARVLGCLQASDFVDDWNRALAASMLNFPKPRFSLAELAVTLPRFLTVYIAALVLYGLTHEAPLKGTQ
jgi:hypothetical protein